MKKEIAKEAWMDILSDYYNETEKNDIPNPIIERWRRFHYYGRIKLVNEMLNIETKEMFLDCGCGTGERLALYENNCLTYGIDISNRYCNIAKNKTLNSLVIRGDLEHLPFKNESYEVCVMVYTFVYMLNKEKVFEEIHRVLKKKGRLVIFDPNSLSLRTFLRKLQLKFRIFWKNDIGSEINKKLVTSQSLNYFGFQKLALKTGFKIDNWCGNFETIPFPMFMKPPLKQITLFFFWLWEKMKCNKWGKIPIIMIFSDFLIIKIIKNDKG